jgi:excisionase family DNA binding protein
MQAASRAQPVFGTVATDLITIQEAAGRLRVSTATVYKLCEAGKLPHVRISTHSIRIAAAVLADFIAAGSSAR